MPIVLERQLDNCSKIGLWHIAESETHFNEAATWARTIAHPHKRLQHLAGRHLLRHLFPDFPLDSINFQENNRPFVPGDVYHFSISHCNDFVAAIVSKTHRVGVDVEQPVDKILGIQHKFISPDERVLLEMTNADARMRCTMVWSLKEAAFKWYGKGRVDFKQDMQVGQLEFDGENLRADLHFGKDVGQVLKMQGLYHQNIFMVWVMEMP